MCLKINAQFMATVEKSKQTSNRISVFWITVMVRFNLEHRELNLTSGLFFF